MISTHATGLIAGMIEFATADGKAMPAYRARPEGEARALPVILVVQEIFGVHEHIRDVCRRLAHSGYCAIAPELYVRQGDPSTYGAEQIPQLFADIVSKVPQAQVLSDLDACVAHITRTGEGDTKKLGITGFCWGGTIVWLYCAHKSQGTAGVACGVAWYGRLNADRTELQPNRPVELAARLNAPVLGLYGGQDAGIPLTDVERMKRAIAAARNSSDIIVYPDAPHGFLADYRQSYREKDARDGWGRMLAWFKKHGVA
jgi:carboxymethylenebutenolidase